MLRNMALCRLQKHQQTNYKISWPLYRWCLCHQTLITLNTNDGVMLFAEDQTKTEKGDRFLLRLNQN